MTPEKRVQNNIVSYFHKLESLGYQVYIERRQAGGFAYKVGIADLYAIVKGQHVEIEVKQPGGELRPMQEKWRDRCKLLNVRWLCVDNVNDLKSYLEHEFDIKV